MLTGTARWQTYSDEGNAIMQKHWVMFEEALRDFEMYPPGIVPKARMLLELCEKELPGQGYTDTEPRGELTYRINQVCDEIGYARIESL